jgi:hypothetical protein
MSERVYKCSKCGRNHRYDSNIGVRHLRFRITEPVVTDSTQIEKETEQVSDKPERVSAKKTGFITGYLESYRNGVKKFGVWWKLFQISIWGVVLILLMTAAIIAVVYLPKIEMIHWLLR